MISSLRSRNPRSKRTAIGACIAALFFSLSATGQEPAPIVAIDPVVIDLFLESRIQKPASQATAQERATAMADLTSLYLVTDLARSEELGEEAITKAQLELQKRVILYNAFAADFFATNAATEQEIFNEYEEQVALAPPKEFKARHILVESQGQAMTIIGELKEGADFIELAKAKSTGPSAPSGGDLGWFTAQAMVKPFSDAVGAMEDGTFTDAPVQTQFGWHVILREDSRDGTPPPLDSVRDVIKQRVEQEKFQNFVSGLR